MRVAVVGGGVAGSASAVALARIGAEVTMYEAYDDPAGPVGSFVSLAVNGLRALDTLGCLEAVQRAGFPVARQRMWSGRGKPLGDVARGRRGDDTLCSVTLLRADLVGALRARALREGARVVTGRRVTDPLALAADVMVGADGIWSATRRAIHPSSPEPTFAGLYSVSGVSDGAGELPSGFNWVFARNGVFIYLPTPDGSVWWSAQVATRTPPDDLADIGPAELRDLFRTEAPVTTVLATATGVRARTLLHVLAPVARRHSDRAVLVGDAAHPVGAGQGASMALEDAIVLARELHENADVPAALAAFDRQRHGRSGKLAKTEAANRDAKTAGPLTARVREVMMPFFFNRFYEKATGWLYDYDPGSLPTAAS